jgi:hypothetical protein
MELEDSNGKIVVPQSPAEVDRMIDRIGKDLDHCILSENERYIQTAGSAAGLIVQYGDPSGNYEAAGTMPPETVKELFGAFFRNDDTWRTTVSFTRVGAASSSSGARSPEGDKQRVDGQRESGPKDGVLESVKREVTNNISDIVRRGVRALFRKFR